MRLALAILLAAPLARAAAVDGPVAVMPFRNLGASPKLDWLRAGIAETMVADLQRAGRVPVVERAQLDRALAQLALQGKPPDEGAAPELGRLVGARTVVVGAFQEAGREVRISARFVAVETGIVRGAAKVTGPLSDIFLLQDQVVESLLGVPRGAVPRMARRPPRKGTARTVAAYELYAKSLGTGSDADKVVLLKQSVAADPGFSYAVDELAALEQRMAGYARVQTAQAADESRPLAARALDPKAPGAARIEAAAKWVQTLAQARRFHGLGEAAERLAQATRAGDPNGKLACEADWARFVAADRLRQVDRALAAGEKFLAAHPGEPRFQQVESRMHALLEQKKKRAGRRGEYDADLAEKLRDAHDPIERDFAPCICARWNDQVNQLMLDGCRAYLDQHGRDPAKAARDHAVAARFFVVLSLAELGDFEKARPLAEALALDSDEWDEELSKMMADWPSD